MKTLPGALLVIATFFWAGSGPEAKAFMSVSPQDAGPVESQLADLVQGFRNEIEAGETECNDMLEKLSVALDDIDAKLDEGVADEAPYLAARKQIVEMRYSLDCLAKELTQVQSVDIGSGSFGPDGGLGGGISESISLGGPSGGVSGTGASFGSLLVPASIVGGVIPAATDNDNSPGIVASQSVAN